MLSLGFLFISSLLTIFKSEPQLMQVPFEEKEIVPQLIQAFIFDLKELKTKIPIINKKRGISNNKSKILPRKPIKKLIPNKGKIITRL